MRRGLDIVVFDSVCHGLAPGGRCLTTLVNERREESFQETSRSLNTEVKIDGVLRSARRQDEQRTLRTREGWKAEIPAPVC
jgi:hypothetical protein